MSFEDSLKASVAAMSSQDKRIYRRSNVAASLGFVLAVVGLFLAYPHKHGTSSVIGWILVGIGGLTVLAGGFNCWRLIFKGRRIKGDPLEDSSEPV